MSLKSKNIGLKSTTHFHVNLIYGEKAGITANKAQSREKQKPTTGGFFSKAKNAI